MMHGRWRISALAALAVLAAFSTGPEVASAQVVTAPPLAPAGTPPRISSEVYSANPLNPDQLNTVRTFVQYYAPQLRGEGPTGDSEIVVARFELLQPLAFPSVSDDFRRQYSRLVAEQLAGAVDPQRPLLTRLNTLIVASKLDPSDAMLSLIAQGLKDPSSAVRYWAVTALGGRTATALNPDQTNRVINELRQMVAGEDALWVLRQVYRVLIELPDPRGLELVVSALNARVAAHVGHPLLPYDAEASGMEAALRRVIRQTAENVNVQASSQNLALAAAKYLQLIGQQGQANADQISGQLGDSYQRMAWVSHQVVTHAQQQFGGNPIPPIPNNQLNWAQINAAAQAARNMLINPPFPFQAEQVAPGSP